MKQALIILNPIAGRLTKKNRLAHYYQLLSGYPNLQAHFFLTSMHTTAKDIVLKYHQSFDLIIVIGGDGTLNGAIAGLMELKETIPLGYIPAGTTNDFARTHQLTANHKEAIDTILKFQTTKLDVGKFNHLYFSYVASFGAYTAVAIKTSQKLKNLLGYYAYILTSFLHLNTLKKYNVDITVDGVTQSEEVIFFAVANATSIGGILNFTFDQVALNDGYLDMVYIRYPNTPRQLVKTLRSLRKGNYQRPEIVLRKIKSVTITSKTPVLWSVDGEDGGELTHVTISVCEDAIALIK
ncbi:MAG: YegS/Rv2252/BmrU family lipid kinase [Erysipelothrix sp.]|jgi:YegS/Rv2252/BmrU family lipid kinase|nr:YegS/Rv2252/BmrU family lipid kinase [Erysipelothrix sp.]